VSNASYDPLHALLHLDLASVTMIRDYVQFGFDGPTLTAFSSVCVHDTERILRLGDPGYWDSLRAFIGRSVVAVHVRDGYSFKIMFSQYHAIECMLNGEGQVGPESAMLSIDSHTLAVWH
jgi:hypothetical protein